MKKLINKLSIKAHLLRCPSFARPPLLSLRDILPDKRGGPLTYNPSTLRSLTRDGLASGTFLNSLTRRVCQWTVVVVFFLSLTNLWGQAPIVSSGIQVVLIDIDSHPEFKEIEGDLYRIRGVHRVAPKTLAPEMITLSIEFSGGADDFAASLQESLGGRYKIERKNLPSGVTEFNISKRG